MALPAPLIVPIVGGVLKLGGEFVGGFFAKETAEIALKKAIVEAIPKVAAVVGGVFVVKEVCDVAKNANDFNFNARKGDASVHMNAKK